MRRVLPYRHRTAHVSVGDNTRPFVTHGFLLAVTIHGSIAIGATADSVSRRACMHKVAWEVIVAA
jgi:hypothetical protein